VKINERVVGSTTQRDALLKHILEQYGIELPDMQAATLERRNNDELPESVRQLLAIRCRPAGCPSASALR
jgi:DNA polymerase bacteriophage-type